HRSGNPRRLRETESRCRSARRLRCRRGRHAASRTHRKLGAAHTMREYILNELSRIEKEHDVRVLMAVESGSRAWGFASPDSAYDVPFIYVHNRDWYLSVFEGRDTIEEMLPQSLDLSGWDLRKTLRLFSNCNLALNEWLGSPIVYSEVPDFRQRLFL